MDLNKEIEKIGSGFEAFKAANDLRLKEIETKGAASSELLTKLDKIEKELDLARDNVKSLEAAMNRKTRGNHSGGEGKKYSDAQCKYMDDFQKCIRGKMSFEQLRTEHKDMYSGSDPDGGYLVPAELSDEIVTKVFETSPLRPLASVMSGSSNKLELLEDLDEIASGWVGEVQARPKTDSAQLKQLIIDAHELYAKPLASQNLLDDAAVNVESWLSGKAADKFARDENAAFITGNGVGKPKGIMSYADGSGFGFIKQVETSGSNAIVFDDVISLQGELKQAYRVNSTFLMARPIFTYVRKLKDSQGQYLWQPSLQAGQPELLLGRPVAEMNDMASDVSVDGALVMAYGDIRAAYQIYDRIGVRLLRDPYSSKPFVEFYFTKRTGGAVKNHDAVKILKIKA